MTIAEVQSQVDDWIKTHGVRYFNEMTNLAILTEEVGELARVMAVQYGEKSPKKGQNLSLEEEMADILFVLTCLANQTGIDLESAFKKTLKKKINRDKGRHQENEKLRNTDQI